MDRTDRQDSNANIARRRTVRAARALPGSDSFEATCDDKTCRFATSANLAAFRDDPERFVPAYCGFCAISLALGRITCPDFSNFQIEDDRLYLFEVTGFTNGRTLWNSDAAAYRRHDRGYSAAESMC